MKDVLMIVRGVKKVKFLESDVVKRKEYIFLIIVLVWCFINLF